MKRIFKQGAKVYYKSEFTGSIFYGTVIEPANYQGGLGYRIHIYWKTIPLKIPQDMAPPGKHIVGFSGKSYNFNTVLEVSKVQAKKYDPQV